MSVANPEMVLYCTMHPDPFSYAEKQADLIAIELKRLADEAKSEPLSTLKVACNEKVNGKHRQPFYRSCRW